MTPKLIWMGHGGHFICARNCGFRLNTYVNGFIVSTVGELKYGIDRDPDPFRPLASDPNGLYETMVFRARKTKTVTCCPYEQADGRDLDCDRYANADDATAGHHKMIAKWSKRREARKK